MTEQLPDIALVLPQQPPMRLLDRVIASAPDGLAAEVRIGPGVPFHGGEGTAAGVPAWVGLEYLAQAAAAWFGLAARSAEAAPRAGMLIACRRYECAAPVFADGSVLTVQAWPTSAPSGSLVKFAGEIRNGNDTLASGEVSVYMPTEEP